MTFMEAAEEVGRLRNWRGFDGTRPEGEAGLFEALREGSVVGKWFIPPAECFAGLHIREKPPMVPDIGLGTCLVAELGGLENYWSCTESDDTQKAYFVRLWYKYDPPGSFNPKNKGRVALCRPCRVSNRRLEHRFG